VLVHHSRDMPRRWIQRLPRENPDALVVQWIFDHLRDWGWEKRWFLPRARAWSLSFLKDRERFDWYRAQGIRCHWLHQGAPSGLPFARRIEPQHTCDVAFLGNPHHSFRIEVLQYLRDHGLRIHIYTNPIHIDRWRKEGFEHVFPSLHDAEMAPVCASARFVLSVGFYPDEWEGYWSSRPYLTLASGGLCLAQYVRGMEDHFENGRHLLWWRDLGECVSLIRQYRDRPEARDEIRSAGWEHVHRVHSYRARVEELVRICSDELAAHRDRKSRGGT